MINIYEATGIMKDTKLCKIEDLELKKAIVIKGNNKYSPGVIIYKGESSIHIWFNNCPHANLTLDLIEGRVQSKNNDLFYGIPIFYQQNFSNVQHIVLGVVYVFL